MGDRGGDDEVEDRPASEDDERAAAHDFVRDVVGRVALELATAPEGRAVGLGVEVRPHVGIELRTDRGHGLSLFVERHDGVYWIAWAQLDPDPLEGRPPATYGRFGEPPPIGDAELRALMTWWLERLSRSR